MRRTQRRGLGCIGVVVALAVVLTTPAHAERDSAQAARSAVYRALDSRDMSAEAWQRAAATVAPLLATGDPAGKFYASYLYAYGKGGFARDPMMAERLRQEAAEAGFVDAMLDRARRAELGLGRARDRTLARSWYEKAALAGSATAADRLARAYAAGELGLTPDAQEAERWRTMGSATSARR